MILMSYVEFIKEGFYLLFSDADPYEHQKFIVNKTFDYI